MRVARMMWSELGYQQRSYWRNPLSAFFTFLPPRHVLVIFGSLDSGTKLSSASGAAGLNYDQYFVPAILTFGVISSCYTNLSIQLTTQREEGLLKRVRSSPLPAGRTDHGGSSATSSGGAARRPHDARRPRSSITSSTRPTRPSPLLPPSPSGGGVLRHRHRHHRRHPQCRCRPGHRERGLPASRLFCPDLLPNRRFVCPLQDRRLLSRSVHSCWRPFTP